MEVEEFKRIQKHNHELMEKITKYEEAAFCAIAENNMTEFSKLIETISKLQANYKPYEVGA